MSGGSAIIFLRNPMINFLIFQTAWLVAILASAHGWTLVSILTISIATFLNLRLLGNYAVNVRLVLLAIILGIVVDSAAIYLHVMSFPLNDWWPSLLAPIWMTGLWALFASTLNGYLKWMLSYPSWASLSAAILGPLAYIAGEKLGALEFISSDYKLIYLALLWLSAMAILLRANHTWTRIYAKEKP